LPWGGHYRGPGGGRTFFGRLTEAIDSTVTMGRLIEAGDHVVVIGRPRGHVRASGAAFDEATAHVWTTRDATLSRLEVCIDTPTMREALGLR
jgi:ketosteroid isomerase-like protein